MRVLLMTSSEKGHLNPMAGVAQHLLAAGHHVGWLTLPEPAAQLEKLGVEILELPGHIPTPPLVTGGEALARLVEDADALRAWIRRLLIEAVPAHVEPVRRLLRSFSPNVAALDGMLYQGVIAAHLERVPWAGVSSALTLLEPPELDFALIRTVRGLAADRRALFESYGLRPTFRTCECLSPHLNIVFATEALVGSMACVPPETHLVGPSIPRGARGDEPAFPWQRLDSRPVVYCSFGSQISWQPEAFQVVAEAAAPLGVQLVISAGELAATAFASSLPGDPIVVPYAPQLAILERASAFVCHGGANSVMEAAWAGVPLILVPICNDQAVQAHFVGRAGNGLAHERRVLGVVTLRTALEAALDPAGELRSAAKRVRESYRARDGALEAARRIASLG